LANEGISLVSRICLTASLENAPPSLTIGSGFSQATSPLTSFSAQLLSQDQEGLLPLRDITTEEQNKANQADPVKKAKRTRLLLDARTELTDDELRVCFYAFDGYSTTI
jgi:meiotic recombination protein REC8, fungi type